MVASAKKLKINSDLLSELITLGILPEEPPVASETEGEMKEIRERVKSDSERESDQMVALKLKELELQIKQQEHKKKRLQYLRELELLRVTKQEEREEGAQTVQSGGAVNSDQFDPSRYIWLVPAI